MACFSNRRALQTVIFMVSVGKILTLKTFAGKNVVFTRQADVEARSADREPFLSFLALQGAPVCVEACARDERCVSALYKTETGECHLQDVFLPLAQNSSSPTLGWQLWQLQGPLCSQEQGYAFRRDVGLCYKIYYEVLMKWGSARTACNNDGGHLLIVDSQEKQDVMKAELAKVEGSVVYGSTGDKGFFLDGRFQAGSWLWSSSGQPLTFTSWHEDASSPNSVKTAMIMSPSRDYQWLCVAPYFARPFVCEMNVDYFESQCQRIPS